MKDDMINNGDAAPTHNDRVVFLDTTLRDGEQTPGVNLNLSEKVEIARLLESMGVDIIEAGFPASSELEFESVQRVAGVVKCAVTALCRCTRGDVERTWEALRGAARPRLHLVLATSPLHMQYKLKKTPQEVLEAAAEMVALAASLCDDVQFSSEDSSRSDPAFLHAVFDAVIAAGARTVSVTDTVGYAVPTEFGALVRGVCEHVAGLDLSGRIVVSAHCHNDLGMAVANTLAAVQGGARQVEVTVNGIGERAGNCALEEVVMALNTRAAAFPVAHGIDATRIHRVSQRVAGITGLAVPPNKPVVGRNAFTHTSGIHQHGVLQNPATYEIMTPAAVGITKNSIALGKLSGSHAFEGRLAELGYALSREEVEDAFARFKKLAERRNVITDDDLEALVNQLGDIPETYALDTYQIQSGNRVIAMASVTLVREGARLSEAATGNGPIDAAYNAAERIVGEEWPLIEYGIKAVTGGMDALGEVTVRIGKGGESYTGRGLSADIIEASILAYVNAINRAIAFRSNTQ